MLQAAVRVLGKETLGAHLAQQLGFPIAAVVQARERRSHIPIGDQNTYQPPFLPTIQVSQ